MYSPTAYFLAGWCSSTIFLFIYPIISCTITFIFFKFKNHSFRNYLSWFTINTIQAISGSTYGFMFGCVLENLDQGINMLQCTIMILSFSCGLYKILKDANWLLKALAYISPFRYSVESMFKIALDE